ncbi:FAD-dependent monooxygenase [Nocardia carnea]|uniref:FAD-dependent monooxygenase n=1 Tax=Nocardia carnea TaxID=37328 RepID=UPI0024544F7E|nr:FAD-dependent monooxygenase [Nocardia carnea]
MNRQVVIAGGGPTGFWLACELQLAGVSTLLLEQNLTIPPHSRALTIHPRTVEVFASRDMHAQFLEEGGRIPSGHFAILDDRLDFEPLDTEFAFTLAILQARTTEILEHRALELGAEVRRGHQVTGFVEQSGSVSVTVDGPEGPYTVDADYLVGCDGTRSTVRQCAGIDYRGTDFTVLGWLGDVIFDNPPEEHAISRWGLDGSVLIVRLPDGRHRLAGLCPDDVRTDWPGEFTFEELKSKTRAIMGTDFGMHSPTWLSRYSNTSRQAECYRKGRVLLAGDAAHQHMPAGGVGLNIGIQDAMNLGWKLAATVNGWAPEGLLDSYHEERHPVGQDLLEHTQAQTALMTAFSVEGKELRSLFSKLIAEQPSLENALAERLSGLSVRYATAGQDAHMLVGRRAPDLTFENSDETLFGLLTEAKYVLLDLTSAGHTAPRALQAEAARQAGRLTIHRAPLSSGNDRRAWGSVTAVLVRPDGYVAWASEASDPGDLSVAIDEVIGENGLDGSVQSTKVASAT